MIPYNKIGFAAPGGALDFSFMADAPAGKHGYLKAKNGHFVFEDGTPIKFFGTALVFDGAICDKEAAPEIVDDLWRSGCNLVRLHHVDHMTKNSLIDYSKGDSQHCSEEGFDKLDYLISLLREKGIYLHLDMHTLRKFLPGDGFEEGDFEGMSPPLKSIQYYDERILELHKKFIRRYLTHVNPYTGLSYVNDPAVAVVQFLNENSITWVTENADAVNRFTKLLDMKFNAWLIEKYMTREALDEAWTDYKGTKGLAADEDPFEGTVRRPLIGTWGERSFGSANDYTSLEGSARTADLNEFFMETQRTTFNMIYGFMRSLGVKCCINCSNLPAGPVDLLCNTDADLTENNAYWNHPVYSGDPTTMFHDLDMCAVDPRVNYKVGFSLHTVYKSSVGRAKDKPFIITEWNAMHSTKFRVDAILQMAAYGALQDWDGIMLYDYTGSSSPSARKRDYLDAIFDSGNDPAVWGFFGIASMIFRCGLIDVAKNTLEIAYTEADCRNSHPHGWALYQAAPFVSKLAAAFIADKYYGDADVVISSGNTATGDYTSAKHAIVHTTNPFSDNMQKHRNAVEWLASQTGANAKKVVIPNTAFDSYVDETMLTADIPAFHSPLAGKGSDVLNYAMRNWGLISEDQGWFDDRVVSDTSQIMLNFGQGYFSAIADCVKIFAGRTAESDAATKSRYGVPYVGISKDIELYVENEKAGVVALALDCRPIAESSKILIRAMGECINTESKWMGNRLIGTGHAPIIYDDIRGTLVLPFSGDCSNVTVNALSDLGAVKDKADFYVDDGKIFIKIGGSSAYVIERS